MQESEVSDVGILKLYRQGDPMSNRKISRPVFIQFVNILQNKTNNVKNPNLKEKIRPSEFQMTFQKKWENAKSVYMMIFNTATRRHITKVIKGDKLVFPSNGSVYNKKVNRLTANEKLDSSSDKIETKVFRRKHTEDNGDCFSSYAAQVSSLNN